MSSKSGRTYDDDWNFEEKFFVRKYAAYVFFPENEYVLRKNLVNAMHDEGLDKARSKSAAACPKKIESVLSCPSKTTFSCIKKLYRTRRHMPKYNLCQEKEEIILRGSRQRGRLAK